MNLISTGRGQIFPYRIRELDGLGVPTSSIVNIESQTDLVNNATSTNGVLPVATFPTTAELPNGDPGNQFLLMRFSNNLEVESILSDLLSNLTTNSGLTTAVSILAYDPNTESQTVVRGRGFVGGFGFVSRGGQLVKRQVLRVEENGSVVFLEPEGNGFPGATDPALGLQPPVFNGVADLVAPNSFVFVADTDNSLAGAPERFDPLSSNVLLRIEINNGVRNSSGAVLEQTVCTATTVGADPNPPDVFGFTATPAITPGNGQNDIDPARKITISFNKPVQPTDVGTFFSNTNLVPQGGGVGLVIQDAAANFSVNYFADPLSVGDFCNYEITPSYVLPSGKTVEVSVNTNVRGLGGQNLGNAITTTFNTGEGPGTVNAPVFPDALYVGIGGSDPGLGVIDLYGYGQGTSASVPPDQTNFVNNPNIGQAGVLPPLSQGQSSLDAGSLGVLTMVEDTKGNVRLLDESVIGEVGDIHIGAPLDLVFNNQNINVNVSGANQQNPGTNLPSPGNNVAVSPHPNPPRLVFPPPNPARNIFGEEPSAGSSAAGCGGIPIAVNLLTPATRPDFLLRAFEGVFNGPAPPPVSPPPPPINCPFNMRQQIGHFLYVLDRLNSQILVVNSNRMQILDTIRLTNPFNMTMSPTVGLLAVTNLSSSTVSFIDTNPRSSLFNTVVREVRVAPGPTAISWQPDGEFVCVLSSASNTLTLISASDFRIDREVSGNLNAPFDIGVTPRFVTSGNSSGVFYAYVLNANGTVAIYESGPDGVNGFGFNDIIGTADVSFRRAGSLSYDYNSQFSGVFVTHVDELGLGKVSRLELVSTPTGQTAINPQSTGVILPPTFRQKEWGVTQTFGGFDPNVPTSFLLSGNNPVSLAFDQAFNSGTATNQVTNFNGGVGQSVFGHSSKGAVLSATTNPLGVFGPFTANFLFVALPDAGVVDVFSLLTGAKVRSLPVPATVLAGYWRQ